MCIIRNASMESLNLVQFIDNTVRRGL